MNKLIFTVLISVCSFSYADNLSNKVSEDSITQSIQRLSEKPPIDNVEVSVFSNTIAGPKLILETKSCLKVVDFLKPLVGDKPQVINDGGYIVYVNKKHVLKSSNYTLFSWLNRCSVQYSN